MSGTVHDLKKCLTTSNCTNSFPHSRDIRILSPRDLKCRTMLVKRTLPGALNSLLQRSGDVECNHAMTAVERLEPMDWSARCHKKCSSLTRNEAVQCQRLKSFACNQCNTSDRDREWCSDFGNGLRLHQHRAICNSSCHLVCTQLPRNVLDKLKTGNR